VRVGDCQPRAPRAERKLLPASPVGRATGKWSKERKGASVGGQKTVRRRAVRVEERIPDGVLGPVLKGLEVRPDPPTLPAPIRHNLFPGTWTLLSYQRRPFHPTKQTLPSYQTNPSIQPRPFHSVNRPKPFHPTRAIFPSVDREASPSVRTSPQSSCTM
jgi:hypothetical protein